jgi:UDP-N-acetylmuramoyl-tripeptide--D-alanyl-D-alanine ligase
VSSLSATALALALCAVGVSYLRWLRVAQREHYLPGMTTTFARRWWSSSGPNRAVFFVGAAGALAAAGYPPTAFAAALAAGLGPLGLTLRGKTSKLAWTARLKRLATISTALAGMVVGVGAAAGPRGAVALAAVSAVGAPMLVDAALWLAKPLEARLLAPFVESARRRLSAVGPKVVAVTGSFGKTTTKGYIAHLLSGSFSVVATPASYNNAAGLARAVNEHLTGGAQVFVAEMGTYGPGEIAAMCEWVKPEVSVITALGPVHLERMGSLERIAEAKAEILGTARVAVLNVDYPLLAQLADKAEAAGKEVLRCSSQRLADVTVTAEGEKLRVRVAERVPTRQSPRRSGPPPATGRPGRPLADLLVGAPPGASAGNVACGLAAAISVGAPEEAVASKLEGLPNAPHRRSTAAGPNGANIIDDTYNSNPAGAQAALELLADLASREGKRVVVTPGMVELGRLQYQENARFAALAASVATQLVVVGRTNAKALVAGARAGGLPVKLVRDRAAAVAWVSAMVGPGDAVLYENDLPDHYP